MNQLGPYEIIRRLGSGGTAEVFLASGPNPKGEELVALKVVLPHLASDERHRAGLIREARTAALLHHPNLVEVYDVGTAEGRPYLAMEYVPGWSLRVLEKRLKARGEKLEPAEACALVREAALGLHYAHEVADEAGEPLGLVHRDVSPHNIIVSQEGAVKVVDFGLAKVTHVQATQTGGLKGKVAYMSPEQVRGEALDRRTDVFALGAILWELVCGSRLHPGANEAEILGQVLNDPRRPVDELFPQVPEALARVIDAAVARALEERTASAAELAQALSPLAARNAGPLLAARVRGSCDQLPATAASARALDTVLEGNEPRRPSRPRNPPPSRESKPSLPRTASRPSNPAVAGIRPAKAPTPAPSAPEGPRPGKRPSQQHLRDASSRAESRDAEVRRKLAGPIALGAMCAVAGVVALAWPRSPSAADAEPAPIEAAKVEPVPSHTSEQAPAAPAEPTLKLESDVVADIYENSVLLGTTPITLSLTSGHHHLSVVQHDSSGARASKEFDVQLNQGDQVTRDLELYPKKRRR